MIHPMPDEVRLMEYLLQRQLEQPGLTPRPVPDAPGWHKMIPAPAASHTGEDMSNADEDAKEMLREADIDRAHDLFLMIKCTECALTEVLNGRAVIIQAGDRHLNLGNVEARDFLSARVANMKAELARMGVQP